VVSFTVIVTPESLCNFTKQFVQGSSKYRALAAKKRRTIDQLWNAVGRAAATVTTTPRPAQKLAAIKMYTAAVTALTKAGWLTQVEAATLKDL
jgi:hypothetical protein